MLLPYLASTCEHVTNIKNKDRDILQLSMTYALMKIKIIDIAEEILEHSLKEFKQTKLTININT